MEKTATITIRLEDFSLVGNVTLFLSSSIDSLIYVNIDLFFSGTGGETRTPDTWFWRPVLYQLSYTRLYIYTERYPVKNKTPSVKNLLYKINLKSW